MGETPRADPAATPRILPGAAAKREPPIYRQLGDDWLVEVTPLGIPGGGRPLNGGAAPGAWRFEVRAEWPGPVRPEFRFARDETVKRIAEHYIPDRDLAVRVAADVARRLTQGERDIFLPRVEAEVQ